MSAKAIVQLVGWALVCFAIVLVFGGFVGEGGGAAHEPGADTMRMLIFERSIGRAALGCAGIGAVVLLASLVVPARRDA